MSIQRKTTVIQKLETNVDMGELPKHKRLATIRVQRKSDLVEMRINADAWNSAEFPERDYVQLDDLDPEEAAALAVTPVPAVHDSLYTADDLATMTIKEMRKLPEYTRIPAGDQRGLRRKQDYVDAILAQRRDAQDEPARARLE